MPHNPQTPLRCRTRSPQTHPRGLPRYPASPSSSPLCPSYPPADHVGYSEGVTGLGDVDQDGYHDLLVAAWQSDRGRADGGAAFFFRGLGF